MKSNQSVYNAIQDSRSQQFKTVNNLLTLQENHVEEFFQYHGESFLRALEQLMEDVIERVVSQMLGKLEFVHETTSGHIKLQDTCLREYERITQENIELDIQQILSSTLNDEVIIQRKMAKQQYLEAQGFAPQSPAGGQSPPIAAQQPNAAYGSPTGQPMGGMANNSGYPIPPAGYDQMNNPYWLDPQTGQMSYTPPSSGMHLGSMIAKGAAWAKWLA
jgi:hypothetical protein